MQATQLMDQGGLEAARPFISMVKIVAPKMCQEVVDRAMQVFGSQ